MVVLALPVDSPVVGEDGVGLRHQSEWTWLGSVLGSRRVRLYEGVEDPIKALSDCSTNAACKGLLLRHPRRQR